MDTGRADDLLGAREAAAYLGVRRETLYAYVSRGRLRSVRDPADPRKRLYRRADLARLRRRGAARRSHGAAAARALDWGPPAIETAITRIGLGGPVYRGREAVLLARDGRSFESVAELLWSGTLPEGRPRWDPATPVPDLRGRSCPVDAPIDALRLAVTLMGIGGVAEAGRSREASLRVARALVAGLAEALVLQQGAPTSREAPVAERLAVAFGRAAPPALVRALDGALVLMADHELTASTFAARVAASTGAGLHACLAAALATLSGPRHGGAVDRCWALLAEIGSAPSAEAAITARLRRGDPVPGFGHPAYPDGDPRFETLVALVDDAPDGPPTAAERAGELVAAAERLRLGVPTSDLGLAFLTRAWGLPARAGATLFAVGRSAGWIAHVLEQREQAQLIRPRARYVGA